MLKMGLMRSVAAAAMLTTVGLGPVFADQHSVAENIAAAVANQGRPETDTQRDAARKPAEILSFAEVKPGMTVVDINSGGGYYTEIISYAVGEAGTVYAHNGPVYWNFVKTRVGERFENRLKNVIQIHEGTENVTVAEGSVDVAITVLAFHDYYFLPEGRKEPADVQAVLSTVYKSLKPGGRFVVVDHVAPEGTGSAAGNTTHRIDPTFVKEQIEAAGFKFAGSSDVLANANDDHTKGVFEKDIRGNTDRFVYKFVK